MARSVLLYEMKIMVLTKELTGMKPEEIAHHQVDEMLQNAC